MSQVLALALSIALAGCAAASAAATSAEITIHYSRFSPAWLDVPRGIPVTIVLRNNDPIDHEWIVGDEATHARHRTGTEPAHDSVPTEVSIPAMTTRATTVTFDRPGVYAFVCHLPGHEAYGMRGEVRVR